MIGFSYAEFSRQDAFFARFFHGNPLINKIAAWLQ